MKERLDELLTARGLVQSRSQAANLIRLGKVKVDGKLVLKPGQMIVNTADTSILSEQIYVSRAGFKLASVAEKLKVSFDGKVVLDIGSSTGGFTDFALQHGAKKVIAVDVGTKQLHPTLLGNPKIELHEQTDIRDFKTGQQIDLLVADVSFISLREILPNVSKFMHEDSRLIAMVKPQFEAQKTGVKHKGVIKNDAMRRKILKAFEEWVKNVFVIVDKADSEVAGNKGNVERFYLLKRSK